MAYKMQQGNGLYCATEYHSLYKVLLCEPQYMEISEIINETQRHYAEDNIDKKAGGKAAS